MNVEEIAQAMVELAWNEPKRLQMGENGYQRVVSGYQMEHMREKYRNIYKDFSDSMGFQWEE